MSEYKCAVCGGVFEKGQTEEEATQEMKENFGDNCTKEAWGGSGK